jgi:hypothetical protein
LGPASTSTMGQGAGDLERGDADCREGGDARHRAH